MPARLGWTRLAVLTVLAGCGRPQARHADPAPTLDDRLKLMRLQKDCAGQASLAFRAAAYPRKAGVINTFTSHYTARLGHCFMLVNIYDTSEKNGPSTFETLEDAFEGRRLGSFFAQPGEDGKALARVVTCEKRPVGAMEKSCASKAQWDAFKARYMDAP